MKSKQTLPGHIKSPLVAPQLQGTEIVSAIWPARRRGKKTQSERSSEMRIRVMNATVECLETLGYTGTTFGAIAKKAGVSRGALQHHYPERNFLIAGALEMLGQRIEPTFLAEAKRKPLGRKRMAYVLDVLWEVMLLPAATAIQDVRAAARTDDQLRALLLPLEHRVRERQYVSIAEALGGVSAQSSEHRSRIDAVIATMRGLVVLLGLGWEREEIQAAWERARDDYTAAFIASLKPRGAPPGAKQLAPGKPETRRSRSLPPARRASGHDHIRTPSRL